MAEIFRLDPGVAPPLSDRATRLLLRIARGATLDHLYIDGDGARRGYELEGYIFDELEGPLELRCAGLIEHVTLPASAGLTRTPVFLTAAGRALAAKLRTGPPPDVQ